MRRTRGRVLTCSPRCPASDAHTHTQTVELGAAAATAARNLISLFPNREDVAFNEDYVSWFHSGMIWGALLDTKKYVGDGDLAFIGSNLAKASFKTTGDFLDGPNRSFQETTQGRGCSIAGRVMRALCVHAWRGGAGLPTGLAPTLSSHTRTSPPPPTPSRQVER
jgi:hypothetical protein